MDVSTTITVQARPTGLTAYANASAGITDDWNTGTTGVKWTADAGANYDQAFPGNTYHINGYTVRAGRIGVNANAGSPGEIVFSGQTLVVDGGLTISM